MESQNNNLPAQQKRNDLSLAQMDLNKPSLLKLKEDYPVWGQTSLQDKEDVIEWMIAILNIKCSDKDEENDLMIQMGMIADLINSQFTKMTIPEIKEAFKMYVAKKFEIKVFRLLDCVSIADILTAYIDYRNQLTEVFISKRNIALNAPSGPSEQEKKKIFNDFLKMIFEEVFEKGFSDDAWYIFKQLESLGKIEKSNEEKKVLFDQQLKIYISSQKQEILKSSPFKLSSKLQEFNKKIENNPKPLLVKNRCRSILVCEFIKENIKSLEQLQSILK